MIRIFSSDSTDFSGNGLGVLSPVSCVVSETLNGEYELQLEHPYDEQRHCDRISVGCIIVAPVPAAMTPRVDVSVPGEDSRREIWRINTRIPEAVAWGGNLRMWDRAGDDPGSIVARYDHGTEVQLIAKTNSTWYEVVTPDGKHGWMRAIYLNYVRTEGTVKEAVHSVVEPRQIRDQPFRVYRVVPTLTGITVYARHISYDLLDNLIRHYAPSASDTGAAVVAGIRSHCMASHDFRFYSDLTSTASDVSFNNVNPLAAILDEDGVIDRYGGELARDWFDLYVVNRVGQDTEVSIRHGKNMTAVSYDMDDSSVATRIIPTGEDKDGNILYLPEVYIDSPLISSYPHPRLIRLPVSEAKESEDKTKTQCYALMRDAAAAEYAKGCDRPVVSLNVQFLPLENTEEYKSYARLEQLFLGDSVNVVSSRLGMDLYMRVTAYSFDCLLGRYSSITLGTVADTAGSTTISKRQLPSGCITGGKLAMNSVGTGALQSLSVGTAQIKLAAIETAHIQDAAINTAKIGNAAITTSKIDDLAVTKAKIAEAAVGSAQIEAAAITSAKIHDGAITTAKIDTAAIQEAKIANGAITNAKIANAAIESAKIADAAVTNAKIASASVRAANIDNGAVTHAKIADAAIQAANIDDLAVTSAKIANGAVTSAKIGNAQIDTAHIKTGAIDTALIKDAAITSAKIVSVNADTITAGTLATERLLITGEDGLVYELNAQSGSLTAQELSEEKYREQLSGTVLVARSVTADQIAAQTITATEIAAGTITTNQVSSSFGAGLDITSNNSITTLAGQVNENWTSIQQTATEIRTTVNSVAQTADEAAAVAGNVSDWMTFGSDGLTIGKTGNNFSMNLSSTQLAFRDGFTDMVWIRNNEANIRNLRAENSFRINGYTFEDTGSALVIR